MKRRSFLKSARAGATARPREMQQNPSYVPLGMYDQPAAFHTYLQDVRDGWPQFYGVRRV